MKYYLKICGFQELGSVGSDGRPKRGRYLLTSMNQSVLNFFPPLSKNILNDCAVLPIIPLYSGKKVYCNYVYHNSRFNAVTSKNNRNEYRIYLNRALENNELYFGAQDIVIMRAENTPSADQIFYYLYLIRNHSSAEYMQTSQIVARSAIKGNYGIYEGELDFFESAVQKLNATTNEEVIIDDTVTARIAQSSERTQENVFNTATFRDFVLTGYGKACAVTGQIADGGFTGNVDVVYIKPRAMGGSCLPSNGIALASNLSLPFLQGLFTINENYVVCVHPAVKDDYLQSLDGRQIRIPPHDFFRPAQDNLCFHRDNIWGSNLAKN